MGASVERIVTVITTLDSREVLEKIGRHLIGMRLIACIQILGPVKSIYRWKGRVEETDEWMGLMKTREGCYKQVEEEIGRLHPYEVPEIAAMELDQVLPAYREWVLVETSDPHTA
jgi:periplasmic divalent cation tolerance protein